MYVEAGSNVIIRRIIYMRFTCSISALLSRQSIFIMKLYNCIASMYLTAPLYHAGIAVTEFAACWHAAYFWKYVPVEIIGNVNLSNNRRQWPKRIRKWSISSRWMSWNQMISEILLSLALLFAICLKLLSSLRIKQLAVYGRQYSTRNSISRDDYFRINTL